MWASAGERAGAARLTARAAIQRWPHRRVLGELVTRADTASIAWRGRSEGGNPPLVTRNLPPCSVSPTARIVTRIAKAALALRFEHKLAPPIFVRKRQVSQADNLNKPRGENEEGAGHRRWRQLKYLYGRGPLRHMYKDDKQDGPSAQGVDVRKPCGIHQLTRVRIF